MKVKNVGVLSLIGVAISITSAFAGPVGVQRTSSANQQAALVAQLDAKRQECWREAQLSHAKGPLLVRHMNRQRQLNDLINRIQGGEAVSPAEIDQALQPTIR